MQFTSAINGNATLPIRRANKRTPPRLHLPWRIIKSLSMCSAATIAACYLTLKRRPYWLWSLSSIMVLCEWARSSAAWPQQYLSLKKYMKETAITHCSIPRLFHKWFFTMAIMIFFELTWITLVPMWCLYNHSSAMAFCPISMTRDCECMYVSTADFRISDDSLAADHVNGWMRKEKYYLRDLIATVVCTSPRVSFRTRLQYRNKMRSPAFKPTGHWTYFWRFFHSLSSLLSNDQLLWRISGMV